ncbi:hypothetical protein [Streptomyces pratensis]|uniref:hypothetical protein n=1 Tax=Streptomyces pratensis TaxID=1169025 RepID=UPI003019AD83
MSDFSGANGPDGDAAAVKQTAQKRAGEGAGIVGEKATDVAGTARERAGDVAGEASARARDVAGELRGQLEDQAQSQTQRLAENVRRLAEDLADMGGHGKEDSPATKAVRQLAGRGRDVAAGLESRGPQGLVSDLQAFARRRPGAFLAGAALAGFATARLGKGAKADNGATSAHEDGDRPGRAASRTDRSGESGTSTDGRAYDVTVPDDSGAASQSTPSYGGSVAPPGPLPVTDPYPHPDPRQQ